MSENSLNKNYEFMQNRELSWLRFNERVLNEAVSHEVPIYEKLKFIAIFVSNLDEFFMVRVGSLFDLSIADKKAIDNKTGMTPKEQLAKIYEAVRPLYKKKDSVYKKVSNRLKEYNISHLSPIDLTADEVKFVKEYFVSYIQPILSPQLVDEHHPFPFIASKQMCVVGKIQKKKSSMLGIVTVPSTLPPILYMPGKKIRYIHIEDIIYMYFENIFERYNITDKNIFCATRNADINPNDEAYEINEDFRSKMKKLLKKRKRLAVVRLEAAYELEEYTKSLLCAKMGIEDSQIFISNSPMGMGYVFGIQSKFNASQNSDLCYGEFVPQNTRDVIMEKMGCDDVILSYPYESMDVFVDMIKRAAADPEVISIKITIYRLAKNAKLIEHLCTAAENGKEVLVLIELRARFDEQNNIDWSERLEQAGCHIIYGLDDYKVHSKVCLITKSINGEMSYITQIGTGNYNEKTAKQYTDFSFVTQDKEIGEDAVNFFNNISISDLDGYYKHLWVAPNAMKTRIIHYINREIAKGDKGEIFIKVNSVTDKEIICKLQEASSAGVHVTMLVRGICCILPGILGLTENIRVYSIVGRYLEHARIYSFGKGEEQKLFIASADIMTRNMDKRVEVGCPIYSQNIKDKINHYIKISLSDTVKARVLQSDGTYAMKPDVKSNINSQEVFMKEAIATREAKENEKLKQLEEAHIKQEKEMLKREAEQNSVLELENKEKTSDKLSVVPNEPSKKQGFFRKRYNKLITNLYNKIQK